MGKERFSLSELVTSNLINLPYPTIWQSFPSFLLCGILDVLQILVPGFSVNKPHGLEKGSNSAIKLVLLLEAGEEGWVGPP
jgi:hypothetical protein